ncbi:MAG: transposase [Microcoleus sp.]
MKARYQFRFYPTDQQKPSLAQLFGCVRVVWNDALALCKQSEKKPKSSENQTIVLEDLNVSGMVKNRRLARAISQQGWYEFRSLCEGKSEKFGRDFRVISPWEPTSQICSDCGFRWGKLALKVRSVQCLNCGNEHDRDENAAKNINKVGTGHYCKRTQRQSKTTFGSVSR